MYGQKAHQEETLRKYMQEADESAGVLKDPQVICRTYSALLHQCALVSDLGHPDLGTECRNHAITQCKSHACVWDDHHCISQEKAQQQESVNKHMQELETAAMNAAGDPDAKCRHFDRIHQTCELSNKMQLTHHLCNDSIDLCNQQNECTWNGTHCVHKQ